MPKEDFLMGPVVKVLVKIPKLNMKIMPKII